MSAEYLLEQKVIGSHFQVRITERRYKELTRARELLSEALAFEQRYELLLGNFISMEVALTEICLRTKVEFRHEYADFADNIERANRHLVNLLTAVRGYCDQVPQDFKCLRGSTTFEVTAKEELRKLFERSSAYRFLYKLRNHVQHRGTAIHGLSSGDDRRGDANDWVEMVKFYANKATLAQDKDFSSRVLLEQSDKIDVRQISRACVQELGVAHVALRKTVNEQVDAARAAVQAAIDEYIAAGADSAIGLAACKVDDAASDIPLLLKWDDVRVGLVKKNAYPVRIWPRGSHAQPEPEEILALRQELKHSQEQAAQSIFIPTERWQEYEAGLPMPLGLFHLYQLQFDRHPTRRLERKASASGESTAGDAGSAGS